LREVNSKLTVQTFFMKECEYKNVSDVNKKLAQRYIEAIKSDERVTSQCTINYNAKIMSFVLKNINTDLNKLTINDIDDLQSAIANWKRKDGTDRAASTKKVYRIGIKKFLYWAAERYEKPEYHALAKQIKLRGGTGAPKKEHDDLFTNDEIEKMIAAASELRDKAIIAVLSESGCRAGELLSCKIKDVKFKDIGCDLTVDGKTGKRTITLVSSFPYLDHYLRQHPLRNDPEKPLWVAKYQGGHRALAYSTLDGLVKNIAKIAGIKKRVHLHNFRHTTATQLARIWTEPVMKQYLGWSPNSNMPSIYISLGSKDMEAAVLCDRYGIVEKKTQNEKGFEMKECSRCLKMVPANATFCYSCGKPLTADVKEAQQSNDTAMKDIMAEILNDPKFASKFAALIQKQ
jgi:integrase/recombinase XerD